MLLNHIAAILLFSGPLFYMGLWMVIDPAGVAGLAELLVRVLRKVVQTLGGVRSERIVEPEYAEISRRLRTRLRCAGVALLLFAIVA